MASLNRKRYTVLSDIVTTFFLPADNVVYSVANDAMTLPADRGQPYEVPHSTLQGPYEFDTMVHAAYTVVGSV